MVPGRAGDESGVMTSTPPEAPATPDRGPSDPVDPGPRTSSEDVRRVGRIRRTVGVDRKIAGVAGGLARHLDVDPLVLRILFVVLALFGGAGLLLYGALWLLLPEEGTDRAAISLDERSLVVALVGVGVLAGLMLAGDTWGRYWFPWPLAVAGLIVLVVLTNRGHGGGQRAAGGYTGPPETAPEPLPFAPYAGAAPTAAPAGPGPTPPALPTPSAPTPRPRDPRRRGPVLFWFTLALVALAVGVLGMVDVAGADVPISAYPALATALVGAMLLVGAFYGRAGGLILLGLVTATALGVTAVAENLDTRHVREEPTVAAQVQDRYWTPVGELVVDLSAVADPAALDGRQLDVAAGVGRVEVIVPEGLDVRATGILNGPGQLDVLGTRDDGVDKRVTARLDVPDEVGALTVRAEIGVGEIVVRTQSQ